MDERMMMELLDRYYTVWQEYNYVYEEWAKAHGLSVNALLVLSAIHEGRDCTQKKISQRWMIPKQTTNMVLKDFERKGYVEMLPMQGDKRNKVICFTPEGKEYADAIISRLREVELFAVVEMGPERMEQLTRNMALFAELFRTGGPQE